MATLLPLRKYTTGGPAFNVMDPCCMGRVYTLHLYNANGDPLESPDPSLHLEWRPQTGESACPDDDIAENPDARNIKGCGIPLRGSDQPLYTPSEGGRALPVRPYLLDLAPFFAPIAGKLAIVSDAIVPPVDLYVAVSHRPLRRGEIPPPWRYTIQSVAAAARLEAPKGAAGILAPELSRVVDIEYTSGPKTVTLTNRMPWPVLGARIVIPAVAGPLAWDLSL